MPDTSLPAHVGIILDGNRRWAKSQSLPILEGHKQGAETFKEISKHAFNRGIKYVSAYIFSTENWSRTEEEVGYLMNLVLKAVERYLDEFHKEGIKIVVLGRRDGLRYNVLKAISRAEEKTKDNVKGTLALCFNYGGREEIVDAANSLIAQNKEVNPVSISQNLYEAEIPDVDLVIRTSGEQRLSGFMQWRAQYAELYFTPTLWPAFTTADFDKAVEEYSTRKRRFGK